jgi:acyl phosphate:glycerol-3-phosphate acyltransferase
MTSLLIKALLSYLLGSIVGSLVIRPLAGGVDIRTQGSGNAGATNALRTLGKKLALVVFVIDVAKGWIASALIAAWWPPGVPFGMEVMPWAVPVCALAVILGHIYPLWFGFKGGKGMATLVGAVLGISVWLLVPMLLTFLITVMVFGFVSLGSMTAVAALVVTLLIEHRGPPLIAFGIASLAIIVYTHRSNIERLRTGHERRAGRLWLFGHMRS